MTNFEILTLVIACLAALISICSWNGQRKLQKENNDLQRATSELAKKQLEILLREEKGDSTARLKLDLERDGNGFKFFITNIGNADAKDVDVELLLDDPKDSPLIDSEYNSKFPAPKLAPGSQISLLAALSMGSPTAFNAKLIWKNPDGERIEDETYTAL